MPKHSDVSRNEPDLDAAVARTLADIQERFSQWLSATIRQVREEMGDRPADEVYAEIIGQLEVVVPGFTPEDTSLRQVVHAISAAESSTDASSYNDNPPANPMLWQGPNRSQIYRRNLDAGWR